MKTILSKLRQKSGVSELVSAAFGMLAIFVIVALTIQVFGVMMVKKDCEEVAGEIARFIEMKGAYDSRAQGEFARLCDVTRLAAELDVDGSFSGSGRLQLEQEFTVTVSAKGMLFTLQVPLKGKATGRSEVYHK